MSQFPRSLERWIAQEILKAPQSTCSQHVRLVLKAKFGSEDVKLNLLEGDQLKPVYLKPGYDRAIVIDSRQ